MLTAIYYRNSSPQHYSIRDQEQINWFRYHYPEYLKTRHWRELNDELIDSNPKAKCWICHKKSTLLIHHVRYDNLFHEKLYRDIYILCFDCHTRTHFRRSNGAKIKIEYSVLVKRMYLLKYTYTIRNFRLGSSISVIFNYIIFRE